MRISIAEARRLVLCCQGLDGRWPLREGKEGVAETIERLGYVQIDTISVVRRAHHHTLWVRCAGYDPAMLHELQAADRRVFEWWATAMSYVPMTDYRYYMHRMQPASLRPSRQRWVRENQELLDRVLDRIREEGPLGSRDFRAPKGFVRGDWWTWKPAKIALETLFDTGELMVTERRNFDRIFDLRERVLPKGLDLTEPTPEERERFQIRRALGCFGFAPLDDVRWQRWGSHHRLPEEAVRDMAAEGQVVLFEIEGQEQPTFCALADVFREVVGTEVTERHLHILSPFDSMVIRRGWVEGIFGFRYRLEAYKPAAEREYGYFALPVLWGQRFAGRVDAKADRKARQLILRQMTFEPGMAEEDDLFPALAAKLRALARFSGCEEIAVERSVPDRAAAPLRRALSLDA